jgi:SpoVK/Ycf46/Vps4 family AAA+-type ATPase
MLNLKLKPSSLFVSQNEEEEPVEFEWHCKDGLKASIPTVKEEFCKERGLKPVKIFITGPPASGKSYYGKQLAEHYNVPHIHVGKMLEDIANWDQEREDMILRKREIRRLKKEEEER